MTRCTSSPHRAAPSCAARIGRILTGGSRPTSFPRYWANNTGMPIIACTLNRAACISATNGVSARRSREESLRLSEGPRLPLLAVCGRLGATLQRYVNDHAKWAGRSESGFLGNLSRMAAALQTENRLVDGEVHLDLLRWVRRRNPRIEVRVLHAFVSRSVSFRHILRPIAWDNQRYRHEHSQRNTL